MKAVIGWATSDLMAAARKILSRPAEYWQRPENRQEYELCKGIIRRNAGFLREIGHFKEPFRDWLGNRFWVNEEGELVRWELAKGDEKAGGRSDPPDTVVRLMFGQ